MVKIFNLTLLWRNIVTHGQLKENLYMYMYIFIILSYFILGHLKKMFWFSDNGLKKKGKVDRVFIFCFYFQSNMGRVFIFCFYFQWFKNITQTSSILLFWQTNNTIVLTLSTSRIVHGTICLEHNCTLNRLAYPYDFGVRLTIVWAILFLRPYDCCQFPYHSANLRYFRKVFGSGPSFHCGYVYYRKYRHFRLLKKRCQNFDNKSKIDLKC